MGGGVSSLPAEVSLAEAKELAGAKWQPAWEEKFAEAKISKDEAIQCWKESEAKAAISEALYEKLHGADRSSVAEALDFSAIVNEKRGQHLPGTREWVFEAVLRWRTDADSAKLFWLVGGGGTGKSVAAAELLARLLDKQNAAAWHFCKHTEPARSAPAVLLRSLAGMLCATVEAFEDALKESAGVETDKVDELFEALLAKPLRSVEAPRGADDALVLVIDALDELPRDALQPVLSLLATELKTLPPWIKLVVTSRDEAQIKGALSGYTPSELRVDEARNRQDVRAYLTVLAKEHVELEVTMESLRHEVEAKFPGLKNLDTFADLEDPLRRSKGAYDEAVRGVAGIHELEKYKERRLDLMQDETDFDKLYADASLAQTILVDALKTLPGDVADPGVKGRGSAERKLADKYTDKNGVPHPEKFRDLSRATVLSGSATDLLKVLTELDGGGLGLEIAQLKNKFASPTPLGYRDMNLNVSTRLDDGRKHLAEVQLNLKSVANAKHIAHEQYEVIRLALPKMCEGTSVGAGALEAFIAERLNSSALDAAVTSLERKAGGLMLYARLIADQLEATSGKIDFARVGALPAGLDEIYAENFRRVFVDDGAWGDALPLVELICAAGEPLTVDAASGALGWDRARCRKVCDGVSLLFPLREGDVIGVLHKTVTDWLMGEAPFDKRSSEDAFFVARDAAHRRLARACARAIRAGVLDTESYSSDAAADVVLASFVEGEGGVASDAYALRWCLFHLKRSRNEGEAVAVACSLSYVRKRSAGDIVSFVADLNVLQGQDTLLLSDSLVLSRNLLSRGLPLLEQLWQRLVPRANAESSPAARRLADDAKSAASKLPLSAVRPMGLTAAGGAERCLIETQAECLATFVDPATGEPRVACGVGGVYSREVRIYDPVAGGAALVVIDVGSDVYALAVFTDPATGEPCLACGCYDGKVRIFDPVAGGEALLVLEVGSSVYSLAVFADPATGAPRLASGSRDGKVRVYDPIAGGEALLVINVGDDVNVLAFFVDPATGEPRLACAPGKKVLVFDPIAGGDALLVLDIGETVNALAVFKEPATSAPGLACGTVKRDRWGDVVGGDVRVFDAVSGGDALLVIDVGSCVNALVAFKDLATGALRLASGSEDNKVRIFDPVAGGEALVVLEGHEETVWALIAFVDPATGEPRLVSASNDVRVWNPAAGGAAIEAEPEGHSNRVNALVTFVDPATGALRVATGSRDKMIRVWDADTGDSVLVIDVGETVMALAFFVDPATGAPRLVTDSGKVFDPVAGGEALVVIDMEASALEVFTDPATGAPRLACGSYDHHVIGKVRVFNPVAGGEALVVIDVGSEVKALAVFADPATGELRIACGCDDKKVRIYNPIAGGEALLVLEGHTSRVNSLTVFTDPATGGLRLASGSQGGSVRVWDLAAGAALFVLEGHTSAVFALTAFADPATGEMRLGSGGRKTLRVWDASKGGAALRVVPFEDGVFALTLRDDKRGLFVAFGKRWGELRVESGTTPLTLACYKGDVAAINDLLQQGAGVDQEDNDGYAPLFVASLKGHVDAACVLLDAGAAVDKRREGDWSPFGIACALGHLDVATLLVERGVDTDAINTCVGGMPPLLFACRNRNLGAMRLCLERGADPNWANEDGRTVLYDACKNDSVDVARLLLDKGAEVDRAQKDGATPLYAACLKGHVDAAQLLLERGAAFKDDGSAFCEGDTVEARYQGQKYYPGKISRDCGEGKYDIAYDDGDKEEGVDARLIRKQTLSPLYAACEKGHVDAARLLLEKGADADRATEDGRTPLWIACQKGHVDAARLLLDNGAEVNRATERGQTPLFIACEEGHVDAARLLLDNGAEVNRATERGQTPLFIACEEGHVDAARLLLDNGAEVDRADKRGMTPLDIARRKDHDAVVALLEEHLDSKFPLHAAARTGDVDAMTQLLDGGATVDAKKDGSTPLFVACKGGRVDAARLLLGKGAEVDQADKYGKTALYAACWKGHVETARLLLDKGAEVDRAENDGWTPLFIACEEGHVDAARLLLDKGAEVDRAEEDGWTPLYVSCKNGHVDAARFLVDKGAGVDRADKRGRTPLDIAKREDHDAVVALLEEHLDSKFPLHAAARTGDVEAMTQLLDGGAEVDAKKDDATPVFIACQNGHVEAVRLLLEKDAEVDRATERGQTPLFIACSKGHVDTVRLLLDKGAGVDRADKRGRTPLDIAKREDHDAVVALLEEHIDAKFPLHAAARTGDVEAITQLLDGGAEVDAEKNGATPLFIACQKGHVDTARLLLERGAAFNSSALCEGDTVEAKYRGRKYYPGKISRDCGEGKYDITYDDGDKEKNVEARLIRRLPLSPLDIAQENGHAAVVALLEEHHWRPSSVGRGNSSSTSSKRKSTASGPARGGTEDAMAAMADGGEGDEKALRFYTACFDGNLDEVQRIVQGNPDLELNRVIHGGTAFAAAVQNSHVDVVRYLAGLGADMETPIHDGATPAFIACYRGNVEIVRFLCSQMVNLETPNANGNTPFAIAAQHRRLDIAEILLQHGVNIAPVNKKGSTPFFFACQEGNLDVVKFLVRNGADARLGKNGISPFHMACYRGHLDVVTYLVVEVEVDARAVDGSGRTPLEVARRAKKADVINFLEQIDAEKDKGIDPLPQK